MPWELTGDGNVGPVFVGTTDQEPLVVKTDAKEALRVDPAGNVGVGTPNPVTKVEIIGNWNGQEGALRLTGDKPTVKLAGEPIAGNQSWIIHVGSDGPGSLEAMRADDQSRAFGAVIGKALQPFKEGQGLIPILIALQ